MKFLYNGWARCYPWCDWAILSQADTYDNCWYLLEMSVATERDKLDYDHLISMVVLPINEVPAEPMTKAE